MGPIESAGIDLGDGTWNFSESARESLTRVLPSAEDFVQNGEHSWGWISRLHTKVYEHGEEIGTLNGEGTRSESA